MGSTKVIILSFLCSSNPCSIISNSKAAQGLLVYLEVNCICTVIPISLSQSQRQLLYRYIIHARPHLTAKVLRYLKTLTLRPPLTGVSFNTFFKVNSQLTSRHRAEITLYTQNYLYLSAKCFVLIKQSYNVISCFFLST